jgi:uncharacterized membrane protein SirB2
MEYGTLRILHMSLATISLAGFVLRWTWMMSGSRLFSHTLTRSLPHLVDTLFLGSGIWLAIKTSQAPFVDAWLTAKVFGLVRAETAHMKVLAFLAAVLVFTWIVTVARTRSAWGLLAGWPW